MSLIRKCAVLSSSLLAGCMFTTEVVENYDDDCQIVTRQVVLNKGEWAGMNPCHETKTCIANLVGNGIVSAASVVVAGSVVVVGNAVYWLEKQGKCQRKPAEKA